MDERNRLPDYETDSRVQVLARAYASDDALTAAILLASGLLVILFQLHALIA